MADGGQAGADAERRAPYPYAARKLSGCWRSHPISISSVIPAQKPHQTRYRHSSSEPDLADDIAASGAISEAAHLRGLRWDAVECIEAAFCALPVGLF